MINYVDVGSIRFQQMQTCINVAAYGSITKAASAMHISQPALSQRIVALELQLGIGLFIRGKSTNIRLTPAGKYLCDEWSRLLSQFQAGISRAAEIQENRKSSIIIATTPSARAEAFLAPLASAFEAKYPATEVRIEYIAPGAAKKDMSECALDVYFVNSYAMDLFGHDEFDETEIYSAPWYLGMMKSNPLSGRESLSLSELKDTMFVVPNSDLFIRKLTEDCRSRGFEPNISYQAKHFSGISMSIRLEQEVFFTDLFLRDRYHPDLAYVPVPELPSRMVMITQKQRGGMIGRFRHFAETFFVEHKALP